MLDRKSITGKIMNYDILLRKVEQKLLVAICRFSWRGHRVGY